MSISFYPSRNERQDNGITRVVMAERCDCLDRYLASCDAAGPDDPQPSLGQCEVCENEMNLANANALDLLQWLGVEPDWCGTVEAADLAARCRRRLWDEERNHDAALPPEESRGAAGARAVFCGRRPGYLREQTERLLKVAERAMKNGHQVSWA